MRGDEPVTLRGILIPVDWDKGGKVTRIGLSARDEREYLININEKHQKLFGLIQKEVEVTGVMREQRGKKIVTVRRYKLI